MRKNYIKVENSELKFLKANEQTSKQYICMCLSKRDTKIEENNTNT